MGKCEEILECQFFQKFPKYAASYKYVYCEGVRLESCARLSYKEINGVSPPAELTPTGLLLDQEPES